MGSVLGAKVEELELTLVSSLLDYVNDLQGSFCDQLQNEARLQRLKALAEFVFLDSRVACLCRPPRLVILLAPT